MPRRLQYPMIFIALIFISFELLIALGWLDRRQFIEGNIGAATLILGYAPLVTLIPMMLVCHFYALGKTLLTAYLASNPAQQPTEWDLLILTSITSGHFVISNWQKTLLKHLRDYILAGWVRYSVILWLGLTYPQFPIVINNSEFLYPTLHTPSPILLAFVFVVNIALLVIDMFSAAAMGVCLGLVRWRVSRLVGVFIIFSVRALLLLLIALILYVPSHQLLRTASPQTSIIMRWLPITPDPNQPLASLPDQDTQDINVAKAVIYSAIAIADNGLDLHQRLLIPALAPVWVALLALSGVAVMHIMLTSIFLLLARRLAISQGMTA